MDLTDIAEGREIVTGSVEYIDRDTAYHINLERPSPLNTLMLGMIILCPHIPIEKSEHYPRLPRPGIYRVAGRRLEPVPKKSRQFKETYILFRIGDFPQIIVIGM